MAALHASLTAAQIAAAKIARATMPSPRRIRRALVVFAAASALAPIVAPAPATAVAAYADGRVERLRPAVVEAQARLLARSGRVRNARLRRRDHRRSTGKGDECEFP